MSNIEELRAAMRQAQVFGKGQYILNGQHKLEVLKLIYKRTVIDGTAKESIICEFKVLETTSAEMAVGETRSIVFAFHLQGWLSRFKALMLALIGVDPDGKIPPKAEEAATDLYVALRDDAERQRMGLPENFMAGRLVRVEAIPGETRKINPATGKCNPVTNMKWMPVTA